MKLEYLIESLPQTPNLLWEQKCFMEDMCNWVFKDRSLYLEIFEARD